MPDFRTQHLQRSLAALVLDADIPDAEDFDGHREGLLAYRELARISLVDPLETLFPITRALLEEEGAWQACVDGFLEARRVPSPHHRDIAPAFLGWMAEHAWGLDRWPWILELAHWELLETAVVRCEDLPRPEGLEDLPGPRSRVVLDHAAHLVSYGSRVHKATEESPRPEPGDTHLLAYRDREGLFQALELSPATALLLVEASTRPVQEVLDSMGIPDPATTLALLRSLRNAGAMMGFRSNLIPA